MKSFRIIPVLLLSLLLSCSGFRSGEKKGDARNDRTLEALPASVPMPPVPDSLQTPESRAAWLALHFWDLLDFRDHSRSLDSAFMEQSFADYTSVLELTDTATRRQAVRQVLDRSSRDRKAYRFLNDIADRYLYDPESPVYSELSYLPFVEYRLSRGEGEKERDLEIIKGIRKNMPGTKAPDFSFLTREGKHSTLLRSGSKAEILLMFYEPDCERCHALIEYLEGQEEMRRRISDGTLRIVLLYQGEEKEKWKTHAKGLPQQWEVGIDEEGKIDSQELFIVRATPTLYMLRPDGTVLAKDMRL